MSWQPIETSPRPTSGRRKVIDVWCVTDDHESARFYFGASMCGVAGQMLWQGRVCDVYWRDGAWRPVSGLQRHALTVTPTHWMPLPDSPVVENTRGNGRSVWEEQEDPSTDAQTGAGS